MEEKIIATPEGAVTETKKQERCWTQARQEYIEQKNKERIALDEQNKNAISKLEGDAKVFRVNTDDNGEMKLTEVKTPSSEKEENLRRQWTIARKILTNDKRQISKAKLSREDTISVFKLMAEKYLKITPEEFDSVSNADYIHKRGLDFPIERIYEHADVYILKEAGYNKKKTVLRMVWPEYFYSKYHKPTDLELFLMRDSTLKADLTLYSSLEKFYGPNGVLDENKKNSKALMHGDDIDKWLYEAFNNVYDQYFVSTVQEKFASIARFKKCSLGTLAKCLDVVMRRGLYVSPLDWYMFNSPAEFQQKYLQDYLLVRRAANLPELEYISCIEKAMENLKAKSLETDYEADNER